MKRLESEGYIVLADKGAGDPRGKKRYRTTEAGRLRFLELMTKSGEYDADYNYLFRLKLGCFGNVDEDTRRLVLEDYRMYLAQVLAHSEAMENMVSRAPEVLAEERRFALLGLSHQKTVTAFEIEWVDSLIETREIMIPAAPSKRPARRKNPKS
jgi:DNA-binding PadR family transcriptional regulator